MNKEIIELKDGEIFVFGSNFGGAHMGGAAELAKEKFGASEGTGEGFTGFCYAFPTLNTDFSKRSPKELQESSQRLYWIAKQNPHLKFLLTKVGCGIAGYEEEYMKSLFKNAPGNVVLPEDWYEINE